MKSKSKALEVRKAVNIGTMPVFVQMIHRHFEKENPAEHESRGSYAAPLDLLRLSVSDPALLTDIERIVFTYGKAPSTSS